MLFLFFSICLADDVTVAVARQLLPAGKTLTWDDLLTARLPAALVPPSAVSTGADLVGRTLAHPIAGGAPFVAERLVGPNPAAQQTSDGGILQVEHIVSVGILRPLLQAGDRVDWVLPRPAGACHWVSGHVLEASEPARLSFPAGSAPPPAEALPIFGGAGTSAVPLPACEATP
jgi:hypothetical protein